MAEFKLGRIRFVWKSNWNSSVTYYKDDIVRNGGNTYVCIQGHTSGTDFAVDSLSYWNKISDGQEWKGNWQTSTYYKENDIVKYGGYLYIANTAHTSSATQELGLEQNQTDWDLYAEGFDYKAAWTTGTRYKINDIVKYGSTIYICTEEHTSSEDTTDGLEVDQAKWDIFSKGLEWRSDWLTNTRYLVNDIVKYGGQVYVCNTGHTSAEDEVDGLELDQAKWDYFHKGIEYKNDWTQSTRYKINDLVKYGGGIWICTTQHTSQTYLTDDESKWAQFVEGLEFEDTWSSSERYQSGDIVTYGGYLYVAVTNNTNKKPTENASDWDLFTTGFRFVGDYADDSTNEEYIVGDVVRLGGYTYLCKEDHFGIRPGLPANENNWEQFWERLNSGIYWKDIWIDGTFYDLGDTISYTVNEGTSDEVTNSYICVKSHASDETVEQNRPDQDTAGEFWNLISGGPENNVMTTQGDLVYYSGSGPARLPIGEPGQVLKVNSAETDPEWAYLVSIDNVYYVENDNGLNEPAPAYGSTLDQPWKTIEYATQQIEKGPLRPNARYLLENNKAFIQNETVEWVNDQIASGSGIWSGFTNDDEYLTVVEFGKILDNIIYDLTHNGNEKIRLNTLSYFDSGSLKTDLANEDEQFVAALEYMETVIDLVLSNLEIGVDSGTKYSSFTQTINTEYNEEFDAQTVIESLLNILTDAVTEATDENIPKEYIPNNTIFVKTGKFEEILPIIIPRNTAVVGDELRSTRIEPAVSSIDTSDASYTIDALGRIRDIVEEVVAGNDNIGKTSGNTEDPVDTGLVVGDSSSAADASGLFQQIADYIDFEINGTTGDSTVPLITGSNESNTATAYTYAVEAIEKNKSFLIEEAVAYVKDTYPSVTFDEDRYRSNFRRYIESVQHDLIYTGNYKSLMAARYYANAVQGSLTEDMFYVRNGTGLRNCTVAGLTGTLSTVNAFGTRRPTAGAFVSLDPGWGPDHIDAWITNKSPYVQNVSTFGTGCIGCKIDGNLHAGGNDSIVANDFTQLVSNGIGVWCTNLGRTELVSVFSYYAHIGYLAENGGKIRATNGNSSYGTFGTVAEGVDVTEAPITASVSNREFDAIVQRVFTDGNEILAFEYLNAGQNYDNSTTAVKTASIVSNFTDASRTDGYYKNVTGTASASGTGATFDISVVNGAVTIEDIVAGGTGYIENEDITISASSIGGAGTGFTINVDSVGDSTEFIVTGEGFGAEIDSVNIVNGSVFEVRMLNEDDSSGQFGGEDYLVTTNAAQGGDSTSITLSNTEVVIPGQVVGMAVFITDGVGAGQYGYIDSYNSGTKIANILKFSDDTPGWDHIVPGTTIESLLDATTTYSVEPRITFTAPPNGLYADTAKGRATVVDGKIVRITLWDPGQGYNTAPTLTITDPNNTFEAPTEVRIGNGVLTQPTWTDRGAGFETAQAEVVGYGFADRYQPGEFVRVTGLSDIPLAGSNIEFNSLSGQYFKLVVVRDLIGSGPQGDQAPFSAQLQLSPDLTISEAPEHETDLEFRIRYSQVRLTGHDFLDIGTGNFNNTNYPDDPLTDPNPNREVRESGGGRVFYTSTDQDGNFRVGELFSVEQSTGVATLNADAFNISGLQELSLGELGLGGTGATITEFSTDGTFTANSDNIVPTQKAIRTYITSQIGGGAATLNVNSITAGQIQITGQEISTTSENQITVLQKMNFEKGVDGVPVAMNYFLTQ
jgi:hypothetical protein